MENLFAPRDPGPVDPEPVKVHMDISFDGVQVIVSYQGDVKSVRGNIERALDIFGWSRQ